MAWGLPAEPQTRTIESYHFAGRGPEAGEMVRIDGIAIEVIEAGDTQVRRVRMRRTPEMGETGDD